MINVENLKKTYDRRSKNAHEVLHGLSFSLPDTGFVCILGPSGCGKTSLLNAIGGLDVFDSGTITTETAKITRAASAAMEKERNAAFGYIFQNYYLLSEHSVAYNVYIGLHSLPLSKKEKLARVKDALARVDMLRYRKRPVGELSGGQQQRVAIARAIARRPRVIFADEPTGNLDESNTLNIMTILKELSRESLVVMVTHEERIARFFADRIITLEEGRIVTDDSDWQRETLDGGAKNTVYSGDYTEKSLSEQEISIRMLTTAGATPVHLTVVAEAERIIIKVNDSRVVLCSQTTDPPYFVEGKRPVLSAETTAAPTTAEASTAPCSVETPTQRKGLELGLLMKEARGLTSGKRLRRFGTGVFIILLSFMLALGVSDIVTIAHIDPEDFIITDPHSLCVTIDRGPELTGNKFVWSLAEYVTEYMAYLESGDVDFDYIPASKSALKYRDDLIPQMDTQFLTFGKYSLAHLSRLDPTTLIHGRMPERSDEIVVDRWVIDRLLSEDGIIQNVIPGQDYLLGKALSLDKKSYAPVIVGICDSGAPSIYASTETLLSISPGGVEVMTLSEFKSLTGYSEIDVLGLEECIVITDNAGASYANQVGGVMSLRTGQIFTIKAALSGVADTYGMTAKIIVADGALDTLYTSMIRLSDSFDLWCADKEALLAHLDTPLPEKLKGTLDIGIIDAYTTAMDEYSAEVRAKLDARTIVTAALICLSVVMLYLLQRSHLRERMELVAVYRLLGIPKRSLVTVFATESLIMTLKCALPTVLLTSLVIEVTARIDGLDMGMIFPLWAAAITLLAIMGVRLLVSILPVLRLLRQPPAQLAAKYDF